MTPSDEAWDLLAKVLETHTLQELVDPDHGWHSFRLVPKVREQLSTTRFEVLPDGC